jgi:hypothetical protein
VLWQASCPATQCGKTYVQVLKHILIGTGYVSCRHSLGAKGGILFPRRAQLAAELRRDDPSSTAVALGADGGDLCAPVSIALAALLGFMFPLIATVFDFGELAHHACSAHLRGRRPGSWSLIEMKMIA